MSGRIDLPDKPVDFVMVSRGYVLGLKDDIVRLEDTVAGLLYELVLLKVEMESWVRTSMLRRVA